MARPKNTVALNGKSYWVKLFSFLDDDAEKFMDDGRFAFFMLVECLKEIGSTIVREQSDDSLECPACTGGKCCFQRAHTVATSEIMRGVTKKGEEKFFKLMVKQCPNTPFDDFPRWGFQQNQKVKIVSNYIPRIINKEKSFYLFQRLVKQDDFDSLGDGIVTDTLIRIIRQNQYNGSCVACSSPNLVKQEINTNSLVSVVRMTCQCCRSFFYVVSCPVVTEENFQDVCLCCNASYTRSTDLRIDRDIIMSAYYVTCRLCEQAYVILCQEGAKNSDILRGALFYSVIYSPPEL